MDLQELIQEEVAKRRTFAIISHPDAGKTTLTEKLLLYSGMIQTAGMVKGRKGRKAAASDWMAMEQERGISITSSACNLPIKIPSSTSSTPRATKIFRRIPTAR